MPFPLTSQNMAEYDDFNIGETEPELYLLLDDDILASVDLIPIYGSCKSWRDWKSRIGAQNVRYGGPS